MDYDTRGNLVNKTEYRWNDTWINSERWIYTWELERPATSISMVGDLLTLSWPLVSSATGYRIECAEDPLGPFQVVFEPQIIVASGYANWIVNATAKQFFKVIAFR